MYGMDIAPNLLEENNSPTCKPVRPISLTVDYEKSRQSLYLILN